MVVREPETAPRVCLLGAALDTGNLGVTALGLSTIFAIERYLPGARITIFDFGHGARPGHVQLGNRRIDFVQRGMWRSRRVHRPESVWNMWASALVSPQANPNVADLEAADLVLDISMGDSFTDLYGNKRFTFVTTVKRMVLRRGRPLVLLPQTYGPFQEDPHRATARDIVLRADGAWARDHDSFEQLRSLVEEGFDPARHREGVDVAFALPSAEPQIDIRALGEHLHSSNPIVGVNVSGLLFNEPGAARHRFSLLADYPQGMRTLVDRLTDEGVQVVLVPHVRGSDGATAPSGESDDAACRRLHATCRHPDRVMTLPRGLNAAETKWVVARLDWFTGARMHATIAALSSGTPVTGIAYSSKMRGVFASCGLKDAVLDLRSLDTPALESALWEGWQDRARTRDRLESHRSAVVDRAEKQFEQILSPLLSTRGPA